MLSLMMQLEVAAQKQKTKVSLKDSLDGKFDMSSFLIDANGFIPLLTIVTEPAVGGFGVAGGPVFIKKRPPMVDAIDGQAHYTPVPPDVTAAGALWTVNNTWGAVAAKSGTLVKARIKYRVITGYMNINASFYHTFQDIGEQKFKFNIKTIPLYAFAIKRIARSNWYVGLQYLLLKSRVKLQDNDQLPSFVTDKEANSFISQPGAIIEFDNRDNIFTPDKGIKVHVDGGWSDNIFGSDFDYGRINYYTYLYRPFGRKVVGGLRIDGQQSIGTPPFYMLPFIDMRGIPSARYQGKADILTESEVRYDFVPRWSIVGFGGTGKAFDEWKDFGSAKWIYNYGAGFRYLVARKFKLRMGIDIAAGPDSWGYYIVFGSEWLK